MNYGNYGKNTVALAETLSFWKHLTPVERSLTLSRLAVLHFQAGQLIRGGGEECLGLILVMHGVIRAHLLSPDGREVTLYRLRSGSACVLSASCVLSAISFETQVTAEEDCDVLLLPIDVFSRLVQENIYVERDSYIMAAERFSDVVAAMERTAFFSLEQRLISFLLDEAASKNSDTIQMTHEQIAINIGSAREAVSRTLKAMSVKGWVALFRGGVRLQDKVALYQLLS